MWNEALTAKYHGRGKSFGRAEFDQLLGDSSAVSDAPCLVLWKELVDAYPEAKMTLTERDEEKWLKSCQGLAEGTLSPVARYGFRYLDPSWMGRILGVGLMWTGGWFDIQGKISVETAMANMRQKYREHYPAVKAGVPKDRLLKYELGSGWEPLCDFLGKPVPDVPFPHFKEAKTLHLVHSSTEL
jgi:Sulfotransferase domain